MAGKPLSSARVRASARAVMTSMARLNAHGTAFIKVHTPGKRIVNFVSQMAVSLHRPGAEVTYDNDGQFTPAARLLSLNRSFFDRIAKETEEIRKLRPPPVGDGSEYDAEEAEQRRLQKLGVKRNSRYLTIGVDNQVTWPREETLVNFDRFALVLLPKTKDHIQSINIDLANNKLSIDEARTVWNRFLSIMAWCDDQFAVAQDGWAGNPVPMPVSRRDLAFTTAYHWIFDRNIPVDSDTRRALALYREARNAEQNHLVSYAVLNYYKVIEIGHPEGPQTRSWLATAFPVVEPRLDAELMQRFHSERGNSSPESHIYDSYRLAVAHASTKTKSDPDCSKEITRLHDAAEILRRLARHFIASELKVSDCTYSGD